MRPIISDDGKSVYDRLTRQWYATDKAYWLGILTKREYWRCQTRQTKAKRKVGGA